MRAEKTWISTLMTHFKGRRWVIILYFHVVKEGKPRPSHSETLHCVLQFPSSQAHKVYFLSIQLPLFDEEASQSATKSECDSDGWLTKLLVESVPPDDEREADKKGLSFLGSWIRDLKDAFHLILQTSPISIPPSLRRPVLAMLSVLGETTVPAPSPDCPLNVPGCQQFSGCYEWTSQIRRTQRTRTRTTRGSCSICWSEATTLSSDTTVEEHQWGKLATE